MRVGRNFKEKLAN